MIDKAELYRKWQTLSNLDNLSPQKRGYDLETLLLDLLTAEGLNPARPYRSQGEQIDGLFEMGGRYFLLEAKWTDPLPASIVYAFRAKVEGKLIGTVGIFVAINGFSKDVPQVLRYGKEISVLLFDGNDIDFALKNAYSFSEVLRVKLRRAAQYGEVYYNFSRYLDEDRL